MKVPIIEPIRNIICLGKNYADHAKEVAENGLQETDEILPAFPIFFSKSANPPIGDGDAIPVSDSISKQIDYEVELAVIIGKTAKNIEEKNAIDYIRGYTILNDVTARDLQTKYGQWYYSKSLDGFCPIGPRIVPKEEIENPENLDIYCKVNGELRQNSNTKNMIFGINRIISELSRGMTLFPGDIIATGTPAGIGHAMNPPVYLKKGDIVECGIEKIGVLKNICE